MKINRILISRIDAIGDVTLTLPLCGYLKSLFPSCEIYFLGRGYTQAVIETCSAVDHFIDYNKLSALPPSEQSTHFKSLSLDVCIHVFPNKHLSFGQGIHFCLGAPLARMEAQIAINTLLQWKPNLQLKIAPNALRWRPSMVLRGLKALPVRF